MSRSFDGVDDKINFGAINTCLTENGALTLIFWVSPNSTGESGAGFIIGKANTAGTGVAFRCTATNTVLFYVSGGTTLVRSAADSTLSLGSWQSFALTWDGSTTAANVLIYKNLSEVSYNTTTNGATPTDNAASNVVIGNRDDGARTFDGLISHVQIFNRVLGVGEIRSGTWFPGSIRNGLIIHTPLWGSSSPEPDYSGNGNHGTITGAIAGTSEPPINNVFYPRRARTHSFVEVAAGGLSIPVAMHNYRRRRVA